MKIDDLIFLVITVSVTAVTAIIVFISCLYWFRRSQKKMHREILRALNSTQTDQDDIFISGRDAASGGELVAQFKVNQGKQVVSLLESDGKRFIHVDGELSASERARMVRYLKSEGFMS